MIDADPLCVLDRVVSFVRRYVVMSDHQVVAVVLWIAHAHAVDAAEATPYLAVTSAEKRSGKSRLLEVLGLVVPRPLATANVSPAALFRVIAEEVPTLLIDESDAIFGGNKERGEELRGLLNAGHRRGAEVVRIVGQGSAMKAERFPVFCAKAIAGIGTLPDTIADRSIAIRLKRQRAAERVERFRRREVVPIGAEIRSRLASWIEPYLEALADDRPALPDALDDRAADGWEPLLAIADRAGGDWPARAREAALALSAGRGDGAADSHGVRLLGDVRRAFDEAEVDRMASTQLCSALNEMEEAPWGGWRDGKGIDPRTLARRLREYDVLPGTVRLADGSTPKGYLLEKFADPWARYCSFADPENGSVASDMHSQPQHRHNPHGERDPGVADDLSATPLRNAEIPHGDGVVAVLRLDTRHNGAGPVPSDEDIAENVAYAERFQRRGNER